MTATAQLTQAITHLVEGGTNSDLMMVNALLHDQFRANTVGQKGTSLVTVLDKQQYLSNVQTGMYAGALREMRIEHVDLSGNTALVKLRMKRSNHSFVSYHTLVLETPNSWKIIHILTLIEPASAAGS